MTDNEQARAKIVATVKGFIGFAAQKCRRKGGKARGRESDETVR
jgi:hypothetical protein